MLRKTTKEGKVGPENGYKLVMKALFKISPNSTDILLYYVLKQYGKDLSIYMPVNVNAYVWTF